MSGAISLKSLWQYGFIAMPVAFAGFPLYVLAPDFYATHYGLSLTLLGTLLLAIRLFDAVQDPLIGWLADKLQGKFGLLAVIAAIVLCLGVYGLFNGMAFSPAVWFALCMVAAVSAYSVLTILLGASATLWSNDKVEQTRIAGVRESFGLVGLVVAVSAPAIMVRFVASDQVYVWYSAILASLMAIGLIGFTAVMARLAARNTVRGEQSLSPMAALRRLPSETKRLLGVYGLSMLASSIPAVLVIFFVRDLLGAEELTGLFLLIYFLSGVAAMPLWKIVSAQVGKYRAWIFSNILAVASFVGAYFLGAGDQWAYAAVCLFSGIALGADLTLPPSILADHVHARGNTAFAGTFYAFLAFVAKASLALASAIALPALDYAGFMPQAQNAPEILNVLSMAYALIPCVLKLMAAGLLYFFFMRSDPGGNNEITANHSDDRSSHHA